MNLYILLDRSGSMEGMWEEALGSINAYVKELAPNTKVFLAAFDADYQVVRNTTVSHWDPLSRADVNPRGSTRLFDSAARIMWRALDDNAERTVVLVMTDGYENASQYFKQSQIKQLVGEVTKKNWEVIFLGANFDKVGDVASDFGLASSKFTNVSKGSMMNYMSTSLSDATRSYAAGAALNIDDDAKGIATGGVKRGS